MLDAITKLVRHRYPQVAVEVLNDECGNKCSDGTCDLYDLVDDPTLPPIFSRRRSMDNYSQRRSMGNYDPVGMAIMIGDRWVNHRSIVDGSPESAEQDK